MSASDHLQPHQFGDVHSSLLGKTLPEIAAHHYRNSPQYMAMLERSIKRHGIQHPIETAQGDDLDIAEGHHRAAVAYKLGIPIPRVSEDYSAPQSEDYRQDTDAWHEKFLKIQFRNSGIK